MECILKSDVWGHRTYAIQDKLFGRFSIVLCSIVEVFWADFGRLDFAMELFSAWNMWYAFVLFNVELITPLRGRTTPECPWREGGVYSTLSFAATPESAYNKRLATFLLAVSFMVLSP